MQVFVEMMVPQRVLEFRAKSLTNLNDCVLKCFLCGRCLLSLDVVSARFLPTCCFSLSTAPACSHHQPRRPGFVSRLRPPLCSNKGRATPTTTTKHCSPPPIPLYETASNPFARTLPEQVVFHSLVIVIVCTYYRLGRQERELATAWEQARAQNRVGHSLRAGDELATGWSQACIPMIYLAIN